MADVDFYVDPDVVGGDGSGDSWINAYSSLQSFETAEQVDLDAANNSYIVHCRSSSGTADTSSVNFSGWTTSAADDLTIQIDQDDRHAGVWDDTKYRIEPSAAGNTFRDSDGNFISAYGLQLEVNGNGDDIGIYTVTDGGGYTFAYNIIKGSLTGTFNNGMYFGGDGTYNVYNNIIYNIIDPGTPANFNAGIRSNDAAGTFNIYSNTIVDCDHGIYHSAGTINIDMNLVSDCNDCFQGTFTGGEYNAYDEGADPANNGQSVTRGVDFDYVSYSGDNFLLAGSLNGTTDQSGGLFKVDINQVPRYSTGWDIGASEYVGVENTLLLCHADGSGGETVFTDETETHTLDSLSSVDVSATSKWDGSADFTNSSTDCIRFDEHADFDFGATDLTIDFWAYMNSVSLTAQGWVMLSAHYGLYVRALNNDIHLLGSSNGTTWGLSLVPSNVISASTWHHIAVVRHGSRWDVYVDGTSVGNITWASALYYNVARKNGMGLEASAAGSFTSGTNWPLGGYLDEIRISNVARWIENFTPPTEPYSLGGVGSPWYYNLMQQGGI